MAIFFAILCVIVLLIAVALWRKAREQRAATGLPRSANARIVYSDTGAWEKIDQPLFSRKYALTGKPDYIIEENGATIPIEVKPSRVAPAPYASDVMQLAAYALLIEEAFGVKPAYGLLKYRDAVFQIDFTDELRAQLLDVMDALREDGSAADVARSHNQPARCFACGYRADCGQSF